MLSTTRHSARRCLAAMLSLFHYLMLCRDMVSPSASSCVFRTQVFAVVLVNTTKDRPEKRLLKRAQRLLHRLPYLRMLSFENRAVVATVSTNKTRRLMTDAVAMQELHDQSSGTPSGLRHHLAASL